MVVETNLEDKILVLVSKMAGYFHSLKVLKI